MSKDQLRQEIDDCYKYLMECYEPTNYAIDTTLSKMAYYNECYGVDKEVETMAKKVFDKYYN